MISRIALAVAAGIVLSTPGAYAQTTPDARQSAPPAASGANTPVDKSAPARQGGPGATGTGVDTGAGSGAAGSGAAGGAANAPASQSGAATKQGAAVAPRWYAAQQGEVRGSRLIGVTVRNDAGENIGDVNEIVISSDGRIAAFVIGVGGFLGIGERNVAVAFESVRLTVNSSNEPIMVFTSNRNTLSNTPEWKWSDADQSGVTGSGTGASITPRGGAGGPAEPR